MLHLKKILSDSVYNIIASILVTISIQLLVLPNLSRKLNIEQYGNVLLVYSLVQIIISTLGNTLNNTRLLENRVVSKEKSEGNFNVLIIIVSLIGGIFWLASAKLLNIQSFSQIIILIGFTVFGVLRSYFIVIFRIKLQFKKQFIASSLLVFGYIIGLLAMHENSNLAYLPFLLGEIMSFLYCIQNNELLSNSFTLTIRFPIVLRVYMFLIIISLLGNLLFYFDKIILFPTLGPTSVAVYFVASFWGKSLSSLLSPISNLFLSYFTQPGYELRKGFYVRLFFLGILMVLVYALLGIIVSPIVNRILYPTLHAEAFPLIMLASGASLILCVVLFIQPAIVAFVPQKYLLIVELNYFVLYTILSIALTKLYYLRGFCYASIIANFLKAVSIFFCGYFYIFRNADKK